MPINVNKSEEASVPTYEEHQELQASINSVAARVSAIEALIPTPLDPPPAGAQPFFSNTFDTPWTGDVASGPQFPGPPGWDSYYKDPANATMQVANGVLRSGYRWPASQAGRNSVSKQFVPRNQLHMRVRFRFSDGWHWGKHPSALQLLKLGRIHQEQAQSGEESSGYIIPRITARPDANGDLAEFGLGVSCCWRDNAYDSNDNVNGALVQYGSVIPASVMPPAIGVTGPSPSWSNPGWITLDLFVRLSDTNQDNGVLRVWWNGIESTEFNLSPVYGGELPITGNGLVTEAAFGGMASIAWAENLQGVTNYWSESHYLETDSVELFDDIPQIEVS